jgi:hypothetical protein
MYKPYLVYTLMAVSNDLLELGDVWYGDKLYLKLPTNSV